MTIYEATALSDWRNLSENRDDGDRPADAGGGGNCLKAAGRAADDKLVSLVSGAANDGLGERPRLGAILVRKGWLSPEQLEAALVSAVGKGERIGQVLVRLGWATEETIAKALAEQLGLAYMDPYSANPDPAAVARLPADVAARRCALPLRLLDSNTVVVAVADPTDEEGSPRYGRRWAVSSPSSSPSRRPSSTPR